MSKPLDYQIFRTTGVIYKNQFIVCQHEVKGSIKVDAPKPLLTPIV